MVGLARRIGGYRVYEEATGRCNPSRCPGWSRDGTRVALRLFDARDAVEVIQVVRLLSRIEHAGVPPVLDHGLQGGRCWVARRHVAGEPLAQVLVDGPLAQRAVVDIARDLLDALDALHSGGVCARDLSVDAVVLTDDGRARLVDPGFPPPGTGAEPTPADDLRQLGGLLDALLHHPAPSRRRAPIEVWLAALIGALREGELRTASEARAHLTRRGHGRRSISPRPEAPRTA